MSMVLRRGGWGMTQHSTDSGPCGAATCLVAGELFPERSGNKVSR